MTSTSRTPGCWTCRLRRKKCDDNQPVCGPCDFRNITCHGYGPKPEFLSSTEDQKKEIARIQQAVRDSFKARRAYRVSKKGTRPSQLRAVAPATKNRRDETVDLTEAYEIQLSLDLVPAKSDDGDVEKATSLPSSENWQKASQSSEVTGSSLSTDVVHTTDEQGDLSYPRKFLTDAFPAQNAKELALITSYLEISFPLQYYFYQPIGPERGRNWLLALILRSKPSYYTVLAFSALQQIRFGPIQNIGWDHSLYEELDRYLSIGVVELQKQLGYLSLISGDEHLALGVEILACAMHLCAFEVFRQSKVSQGSRGDWEIHLNAAGSLVSIIGAALIKFSEASASPETENEKPSPNEAPAGLIFLNEIACLDFFTTVYVWADIIRCVCLGARSPDQDPFPYLPYLEEERIRLGRIIGVRNWAMIAMRQISDLERWKLSLKDRLDVPMLYRRAAEIEARLDHGLGITKHNSHSKLDEEGEIITEIFALSALLYLAIVVSGNSCLTPKVRLGVPKVLDKINHLPAHLLMRVSWPYCVAGCMTSEDEKDEFRAVLGSAVKRRSSGTLLNSLELMEEFWIIREDPEKYSQTPGPSNTPWAIAMAHLETKVLLA